MGVEARDPHTIKSRRGSLQVPSIDDALAVTCSDLPSDLPANAQYLTSSQARGIPGLLEWMFQLTKTNMRDMYEACEGWGWDDAAKREELGHDSSRYLVVGQHAFVHLRYEMEDLQPIIYVYEIQVDAMHRGKQLGRKLMEAVEALSKLLRFRKVMLTVFSSNVGARKFYQALGYQNDASTPDGPEAGYFILSKEIP